MRATCATSRRPPRKPSRCSSGTRPGFHLRDGDARLPAGVRIIDLPPSSPELNPCEPLWDIVKDDLANRIYATVAKLRAGMKATLRRFCEDPGSVLSLIGRDWLQVQLNASRKTQVSF